MSFPIGFEVVAFAALSAATAGRMAAAPAKVRNDAMKERRLTVISNVAMGGLTPVIAQSFRVCLTRI
jgi:hypothetical protein